MFNHVVMSAEGFGSLKIPDTGQIALKGASKLTITVFDTSLASPVAKAIRDSGMNLNPSIEGNVVNVTISKPSNEARDNLIKVASKAADKLKLELRQIRKDGMDALKKAKGGSISEDDIRKLTKDIDTMTEKKVEKVVKLMKEKEKEISSN